MAKFSKVNFTPATGAEAVFELKNVLTASGWTVVTSSDTDAITSGSDVITSAAYLTGTNSWFVIQEPTGVGGRQWCWQRISSNISWRVKVSPHDRFIGGSPGLTQVPSATDEGILGGGGTDASPSGDSLFENDGTYKFHIVADDTPIGPSGNQAYGFWAFSNLSGQSIDTSFTTFICQEPIAPGTYPALVGSRTSPTSGDADPVFYSGDVRNAGHFQADSGYMKGNSTDNLQTFKYFYDYGGAGEAFVGADEVHANIVTRVLSMTPTSNEDVALPLNFGRGTGTPMTFRSSQIGWKGSTRFLRGVYTNRGNMDTLNLTGSDAYIYVRDLLIPWPSGTTPIP